MRAYINMVITMVTQYFWNIRFEYRRRKDPTFWITGLFLDDERIPSDVFWLKYYRNINWKIVRNINDFRREISTNQYLAVSFDHDLGPYEKIDMGDYTRFATGVDAIRAMIGFILDGIVTKPRQIYYHSQNQVGLDNMKKLWDSFEEYSTRL